MKLEHYIEGKYYVYRPIKTGLSVFDKTDGFGSDDFAVIAGATGSMKTYLAMSVGMNAAKAGSRVLYINGEILKSEFVRRMINMRFDFEKDFGELDKNGLNRFMVIHQDSMTKQITYDDVENWVETCKPDLLIIDLFGCLIDPAGYVPSQTYDYATRFSFYPKKYNCAVLVTEQFTKEVKGVIRPDENSIAGGKSLSNKATKIITIYNYYRANADKAVLDKSEVVDHTIELIVRKDRSSRIPMGIAMVFYEHGFRDLYEAEKDEYKNIVFAQKRR